eukprot:SAG11_NODE_6941_length_1222_cov_1.015138_2_plen_32_part_00
MRAKAALLEGMESISATDEALVHNIDAQVRV